jgi:hypothetical protein
MGILTGLESLVGGAAAKTAGGIIDSITKGVSTFVNTPAQKLEYDKWKAQAQLDIQKQLDSHNEALQAIYEKQYETQLADVKNSRDSNVAIQQSTSASWMAKNVMYIIGLFVIGIWGFVTVFLVLRALHMITIDKDVNMEGVLALYAAISAASGTIIQFFYGSSASSQKAQDTISKIANQP